MRKLLLLFGLLLASCANTSTITVQNQWVTHVNSGGGLTITANTVLPLGGERMLFVLSTQTGGNVGCPTITLPANITLTEWGSPTCHSPTNTKNESHVYTGISGSNDQSYSFTVSQNTNMALCAFDISDADPSNGLDVISSFTLPTLASTITAPALTTTKANDLVFTMFLEGGATYSSMSGGWTTCVSQNGSPSTVVAYQLQAAAGAISPPTATYSAAPSTAETVSFAVPQASPGPGPLVSTLPVTFTGANHSATPLATPTPPPTAPRSVAPIYAYVQGNTTCGGGYMMDSTAAQDLLTMLEYCHGDPQKTALDALCAGVNSNCSTIMYFQAASPFCQTSYSTSYTTGLNGSTGDEAYTHNSSTHSQSTRMNAAAGGGNCTIAGASGGTLFLFPNLGKSEVTNYLNGHLEAASDWLNGNANNGIFYDNMGYLPAATVYTGSMPNEWPNITTYTSGLASFANNATHNLIMNHYGPGGGAFNSNNNATGSGSGIVNWLAGDENTLCTNYTGSNFEGGEFEKAVSDISGGTVVVYPYNWKVMINTASVHWSLPNCREVALIIQQMSGCCQSSSTTAPQTTAWNARALATALRLIMNPDNFTGSISDVGVMNEAFPDEVTQNNESSIFSEEGLQVQSPFVLMPPFCYGGNKPLCNGNGQGSGSANIAQANGCGPDSGGLNAIVQGCGSYGNDTSGESAGIIVREFRYGWYWGTYIGSVLVVLNPSTSTDVNINSLTLNNSASSYTYRLRENGTELYDDPLHPGAGHTLCVNSTICTGSHGYLTTNSGSNMIVKHCTMTGSLPSRTAYYDAIANADCGVGIFMQQHG